MSTKRKKRFEKFLEKELKKEKRAKIYKEYKPFEKKQLLTSFSSAVKRNGKANLDIVGNDASDLIEKESDVDLDLVSEQDESTVPIVYHDTSHVQDADNAKEQKKKRKRRKKSKTAVQVKEASSSEESDAGEVDTPIETPAPVSFDKIDNVVLEKAFYVPVKRLSEIEIARLELPVVGEEQIIMETINANSVTIICGETGSGKTTQVPQFLYEAGFGHPEHPLYPGIIGVTQPRRVAAVSMANRVAEELQLLNGEVTYQIRYDKAKLGKNTRIKFMTDGILLRELSSLIDDSKAGKGDMLLSQYSCIIIDEAHQRTVGSDILIGWLSRIVKLRNSGRIKGIGPLKVVIMSATLRVEDFTQNESLFPHEKDSNPPPVVEVKGRQHKVVIHYNKLTPELDYIDHVIKKVSKIHRKLPPGGILVFVTGQQEVRIICKKLNRLFPNKKSVNPGNIKEEFQDTIFDRDADDDEIIDAEDGPDDFEDLEKFEEASDAEEEKVDILQGNIEDTEELDQEVISDQNLFILPLYSLLSTKDQLRIFQPPPENSRLVVVATNIAETSITIPGIRYVVDTGKVKQRKYDTQTGIQNFQVEWTSMASADQRAGRAGRVGPGHCYRLFSSTVYENYFTKFDVPEIQRVPIEGVVLSMKSMGINKVVGFPFPSPPDRNMLADSEKLLATLGALDEEMRITPLGKHMALFPVQPRYAKLLVLSAFQSKPIIHYCCAIVAAQSVGELFVRDTILAIPEDEESDPDDAGTEKESRKKARSAFFKQMMVEIDSHRFLQDKIRNPIL
jgi:ATP-dependent RNA helicase DHX37/DHR1